MAKFALLVQAETPIAADAERGVINDAYDALVSLGHSAADARHKVESPDGPVKLPESYRVEWSGEFAQMQKANATLIYMVPLSILLIMIAGAMAYFPNFQLPRILSSILLDNAYLLVLAVGLVLATRFLAHGSLRRPGAST